MSNGAAAKAMDTTRNVTASPINTAKEFAPERTNNGDQQPSFCLPWDRRQVRLLTFTLCSVRILARTISTLVSPLLGSLHCRVSHIKLRSCKHKNIFFSLFDFLNYFSSTFNFHPTFSRVLIE